MSSNNEAILKTAQSKKSGDNDALTQTTENTVEVLRKELGETQSRLNEVVIRYNRLLKLYNELFNSYLSEKVEG